MSFDMLSRHDDLFQRHDGLVVPPGPYHHRLRSIATFSCWSIQLRVLAELSESLAIYCSSSKASRLFGHGGALWLLPGHSLVTERLGLDGDLVISRLDFGLEKDGKRSLHLTSQPAGAVTTSLSSLASGMYRTISFSPFENLNSLGGGKMVSFSP